MLRAQKLPMVDTNDRGLELQSALEQVKIVRSQLGSALELLDGGDFGSHALAETRDCVLAIQYELQRLLQALARRD